MWCERGSERINQDLSGDQNNEVKHPSLTPLSTQERYRPATEHNRDYDGAKRTQRVWHGDSHWYREEEGHSHKYPRGPGRPALSRPAHEERKEPNGDYRKQGNHYAHLFLTE